MRGLVFALLGQAVMSACSIDTSANPGTRCDEVTSCAAPQICYRGFCVHGDDVPAIDIDVDVDAAPPPNIVVDAGNATSMEAGEPALTTTPTPADSRAADAGGSAHSMIDDAVASPPAQANTPPAAQATPPSPVATPPAENTTPTAAVATPPAPVATPPAQAAPPPAQANETPPQPAPTTIDAATPPSVPAEPPRQSPTPVDGGSVPDTGRDSGTNKPGNQPGRGGREESPLLACLPACATRSLICVACLAGNRGNYDEVCDAKEQRGNPALRELCEFMCNTRVCQR